MIVAKSIYSIHLINRHLPSLKHNSGTPVEAASCGRLAQEKELHRHELNIERVLHEGIFGVVYTGCLRGDNNKTPVVIKMLTGKVWATKDR